MGNNTQRTLLKDGMYAEIPNKRLSRVEVSILQEISFDLHQRDSYIRNFNSKCKQTWSHIIIRNGLVQLALSSEINPKNDEISFQNFMTQMEMCK